MLSYSEIKPRTYIVFNGEPYEVLSSHVFRKQQRKPVNQTRLKHLITGKVIEYSFGQSEKAQEAEISKKKALYLFHKTNRQTGIEEYWFSYIKDRSQRFFVEQSLIGEKSRFMKENTEVDIVYFEEKPIEVELPVKISLKVKEAPPAVKGNTATGANKQVILETGTSITVPIFINQGDSVIINTEKGEYVSRDEKK